MTREEFYNGDPFCVLGFPKTFVYDTENEVLRTKGVETHITEDDDNSGFQALLPVFGYSQPIMIKFMYCEKKYS